MSIPHVAKRERSQPIDDHEPVLLGAFAPSLTQITMEIDCVECGRPVYISPNERGSGAVVCIMCGLQYFNEADRETVIRALIPQP